MRNTQVADIKCLLKDPRATAPTLVSIVYRYDSQRFVYSTGQSIEPFQWDSINQRAYTNQKSRTERSNHESINAHLDRHRAALIRVMASLRLAGAALDNTTIRQHLDRELNKAPRRVAKMAPAEQFTDYVTRFVAEAKTGDRLNAKNGRFSDGTLTNFLKVRNILLDYQTKTRQRLTNEAYTMAFYDAFKKYLITKGHALNYVGAVLNAVKMLLKYAHRDGLTVATDFQQKAFRKIEEQVDTIYLTDEELNDLVTLNLSKDPRLDRVRDLFLIGCYTGLRFSDYTQLRPTNITYGGTILSVTTQKTRSRGAIPLNANVLAILAKYDGVPPPAMSNQKFNAYLKELAQRAGFTTDVERTRTQGGQKSTLTASKWEFITSHTARRSFATNAFLAGVPTVSIMKITGHVSETQFMKYIKITAEQNALLLLHHPHFSGATTGAVMPLHKVA